MCTAQSLTKSPLSMHPTVVPADAKDAVYGININIKCKAMKITFRLQTTCK